MYKDPNPRLAEILMSPEMFAITAQWTFRVYMNLATRLEARGIDPSGPMMSSITANVIPYQGFKEDRWVGEITIGVNYAQADNFGRHHPAEGQHDSTYEGHNDLRGALYAELRPI